MSVWQQCSKLYAGKLRTEPKEIYWKFVKVCVLVGIRNTCRSKGLELSTVASHNQYRRVPPLGKFIPADVSTRQRVSILHRSTRGNYICELYCWTSLLSDKVQCNLKVYLIDYVELPWYTAYSHTMFSHQE